MERELMQRELSSFLGWETTSAISEQEGVDVTMIDFRIGFGKMT